MMRRCTVAPQDPSSIAEPKPARRNDPILVAEMQLGVASRQFADQPIHRCGRVRHLTEKPHLAAAPDIGDRHRVLRLRYVESDKGFAILPHGPPSVHEARLGPSEQPSLLFCTKGRAAGLSPGT